MTTLQGLKVVIIGAGTGMGRATAESLAREGADVVIGGRRKELLDEVARGTTIRTRSIDVSNREDMCERTRTTSC